MRRILLVLTVAAMMAMSGVALAQGDVCVSIKGEEKMQKGASICESDTTSRAKAIKGSQANADFGSDAKAINGSDALASDDSTAAATNDGQANATDNCTATAQNGENVSCP
jgi:hypothetical protein